LGLLYLSWSESCIAQHDSTLPIHLPFFPPNRWARRGSR
jgi:hypothetical protein